MTGTLDAAPGALPANLADVIGTHVELALRAGETAPGRYALDDLRLQMASLSLQGSGSADLAADNVQGILRLDAPDLARFAGLAATELAGKASLQVSASGAAAQPELKLALDGSDLRAAGIAAARLTSAFDVAFTAPLGRGAGRLPDQRHRYDRRPDPGRPRSRRRWASDPGSRRRASGQRRGHRARPRAALVPGRADWRTPGSIATGSPAPRASMRRCPSLPRCCRASPPRPRWPVACISARMSCWVSGQSGSRWRWTAPAPACAGCRRAHRSWLARHPRCRLVRWSSLRER